LPFQRHLDDVETILLQNIPSPAKIVNAPKKPRTTALRRDDGAHARGVGGLSLAAT
jgi:hypothetical protein